MGISSLSLVSGMNPAGEDALPDGAFQLAGKSVIPALDGAVPGGPGAVARFFFRLYSGPAAGTPEVAMRPAAELPSAPPSGEQRQLIKRARATAIE
jgi:hypothetical protein